MEMNYDELVQALQYGKIDFLQFVLAQEDIASEYLQAMKVKHVEPDAVNAGEWFASYEKENLKNV
jgi:hypothetical protein